MKKIIVLAIVGLFVASFAMAQDVTLSGEVESRYMNDMNNKHYTDGAVVEVKLDAVVDDTASLYIEWEENGGGASAIGDNFDKAHFTLDLGAIFDLPVGVMFETGWDEYDLYDAVKVTAGEFEDWIGTDWKDWGHQLDVEVNDMVSLRALWAANAGLGYYSIGAAVTKDPIYVEVGYVEMAYGEIDKNLGSGNIEGGVEFAQDVADGMNVAVAVTGAFDLNDAIADDTAWRYGAGAAFTYMEMYTVGGAVRGFQGIAGVDSEVNAAQIDLSAQLNDMATLFVFIGLGLDGDIYDNTFDSLESSVQLMIGPSTWYLGYMYIDELGAGIASEKSDFGPEEPDTSAIFVRGELKY
jgi:hypothetical protein